MKSKIEKNPISDVNGSYFINKKDNDDESKKDKNEESINKSKYVVYYNSSKNNYDILNVNDVLNNENKSLEVTVENDKIYTSSDLVDFYMNKSIFEELFGNSNALIIFLIILVEVISLLILWFINIKKFKESST